MTKPVSERPNVLLTGDYQRREFHGAVGWLQGRANVVCRPEVANAMAYLETAAADPLLLVVAQSYPDQFSAGQVEQLHRLAPLSRLAALLGSWCEGEYRSGRPWPGVVRLYWHQFEARLARLLDRARWQPEVVLPRTSTIAEQLGLDDAVEQVGQEGLIAIRTAHFTDFDALAESLRQSGFAAAWLRDTTCRDVRGTIAVVWDGGHCDWSQRVHLDEVGELSRIAPLVALLDFPREQDINRVRQAGASAVVSRPFLISDLLFQIQRLNQAASPIRVVA